MNEDAPRLVTARRGFSITFKGKALQSLVDPIAGAERIAAAQPIFKQTVYLCQSPLLGYGIGTLLKRITADSAVLCVETNSELFTISAEALSEKAIPDSRFRLMNATDGNAACSFLRTEFGPRRFRRVVVVRLSGGYALDEKTYDEIENALRGDIAMDWANAMTLVKLGRRYALNAVRNLALLPTSRPLSDRAFGNEPILVLGAGPSLDQVEPLLRARRRYRIICVDTALIPLLERGITPDLVVVLEAQHWNLRDFIGAEKSSCPLALDLSVLPRSAFATAGARFLFSVTWAPLRLLDRIRTSGLRPPEIAPLGSVGLAAVAVALKAGTGTVVVAGLDFAYEIGAYHARSAPSRIERLMKSDRLRSLIDPAPAFREGTVAMRGKSGREVRTDPALRGYRDLFRREFGASERLHDVGKQGLDLGIRAVSLREAESLLNAAEDRTRSPVSYDVPFISDAKKTAAFIDSELDRLRALRSILTGELSSSGLDERIDECDYLWAHFPECAGADGKRPAATDIAFLKRVRAEIDPFEKAFSIARAELLRIG